MKKVIISGAAGFLGVSTTKEFLDRGYEVYALLRPDSEHNKRLDEFGSGLHRIEIDCSDFNSLSDVISSKCDIFIHLVSFGARDDFRVQKTNMEYCISALEGAASLGCSRYICIGSQAEIGLTDKVMNEDITLCPVSSYGAGKAAALYLTRDLAGRLGVDWIWGRIFSLYGKYAPPESLIPNLIRKLKADEDIYLSSCEQNWDYLNTVDASRALVCLAERGHSGEIYNLSSGKYRQLKDYIEIAKNQFDYKGVIHYGSKNDPFISLQPVSDKIFDHTGWKANIDFGEGVRKLAYEED